MNYRLPQTISPRNLAAKTRKLMLELDEIIEYDKTELEHYKEYKKPQMHTTRPSVRFLGLIPIIQEPSEEDKQFDRECNRESIAGYQNRIEAWEMLIQMLEVYSAELKLLEYWLLGMGNGRVLENIQSQCKRNAFGVPKTAFDLIHEHLHEIEQDRGSR